MKSLPLFGLVLVMSTLSEEAKGQVFGINPSIAGDTTVITANGMGSVLVPPIRAVVYAQIDAEDSSAGLAALANSAVRDEVLRALADLGFGEEVVSLWGYGAGPAQDLRQRGPPSADPTLKRFETKAGVRIIVEPLRRFDEVVSALLLAGAQSIIEVIFEAGDSEAARREAASIAVSNARAQAESVAEAAGGMLGDLVNVITQPDMARVLAQTQFLSFAFRGQGVQIRPSDLSVRVSLQVTWVFVPR